jgi:hypothetical protein
MVYFLYNITNWFDKQTNTIFKLGGEEMKTNEMSALKRQVYLTYHQDGILDIAVGTIVLGFGTFMLTDNIVFLVLGWLVAIQYTLWKKRLTIPRFGYVRINSQKKDLNRSVALVGLGVLVLFALFAFRAFFPRESMSPEMVAFDQRYHMVLLSGMLFGAPAFVVAALAGLKRFYLYAFLAVALPALAAWLEIPTYIPMQALGAVALIYGIVLMVVFLRKYPLAGKADNDDSQ